MGEHWSTLLMDDHQVTEKVFATLEKAFAGGASPDPAFVRDAVAYLVEYVDGCHNRKEEEHLFRRLEDLGMPRHGGPLAVMLGEHERSRELVAQLRPLGAAYAGGDPSVLPRLRRVLLEYTALLKQHFWKENDILYPMARRFLSPADDEAIVRGIEAVEASLGPDTRARYHGLANQLSGQVRDLVHGLDHAVLGAILNTLPVELSFIDADDTVRYFSHEDQEKIFPRLRSAIGTNVRNCHPQKSLHMVEQIISDFKAGTRTVAEFWLDFQERKVHVRYFAVRDKAGAYLGTLETVQDITPIQAISGQKRLLDA
jgi:DUF438 domain-containing protein